MPGLEPLESLKKHKGSFFSGEWPTLPQLFHLTAAQFGDRACFTVYDPGRNSITYNEALNKIERLAGFLAANGIHRHDKVAVSGKNSPEWAVAYLAILQAGAVVVPIDYQLKNEEIEKIIRASDAKGLFIDEEKFDNFEPARLGLLARWSLSKNKAGYLYALPVKDEYPLPEQALESDVAAILFTSGTTGTPKGVMLTHANLVSDCFLAQCNMEIFASDIFYALLPLHHSYTMLAVFIEAISVGAEIVFGQRMVTKAILQDLKEAKVTMLLGVPLLFNKVLDGIMKGIRQKGAFVFGIIRALMGISGFIKKVFKMNPGKVLFGSVLDKASLRTIRICISGGGPLAPSVFRKYNQLGINFVQGYGLTETSPILTLNPVEAYKETSVGKIIPQLEVRILEPDHDQRGEIMVRGPVVMQGYYKNQAATDEVLSKDGWLKTGDVGYIDGDNYLYLTGRAKNLIVTSGGKNVYPEEIEHRFQLFPQVEQVLIRGYVAASSGSGDDPGEEIEAFIYPAKDFSDTYASAARGTELLLAAMQVIVDKVNAEMLPYQRISRVKLLEEPLEMTTTKKVKRFVLAGGKN